MSANLLPEKTITAEELAQFAHLGQLYAVLDACDSPVVQEKIQEPPKNPISCLYTGQAKEEFSAYAPYLFHVDQNIFDWVCLAIAQPGGGILIVSDQDHFALYKHLRRFLLVSAPDGKEMYFRFYDPRVLPKFLTVCTEAERRDLYGPILAFGLISEGEIRLLPELAGPLPETAPPRSSRPGLFLIRPAHLQAFFAEGELAFEKRLAEYLREHHGNLVNSFLNDTLLELVRNGIARARRYGLRSEADLTAFVAIMFAIAPNFDQHRYIQDVLTDRRLLPTEKIDALVKRVPDFVWEEAGRRYDMTAWRQPK